MAQINSLLRIKFILEKTRNRYAKKRDLIKEWSHRNDIDEISNRTLERDIDYIRQVLGIDLDYHSGLGYMHNNEEHDHSDFLDHIELFHTINKYKDHKDEVFLDKESKMQKGAQWRPLLIQSIIKKEFIEFDYEKFDSTAISKSKRRVLPLKLTSHQNMWYLIALENEKIKTFGLDRITEMVSTTETFKGELRAEVQGEIDNYRNRIGVSMPLLPPYRPIKIELGVSDFYLNYIKTKPIHFSQEITTEKINELNKVVLHLTPNIDFVKTVVAGVGDIKVLGPEEVVELVKGYVEKIS